MFVIIKGAGDIASGTALRLHHAGFDIVMTDTASPLAVRRTVSFCQAVYDGVSEVEDLRAALVHDEEGMRETLARGEIPLFIDPDGATVKRLKPDAVVDGIMAKRTTGCTSINDAPIVIGLGPGFTAGLNCHGAVETSRGHNLGRLITEGSTLPNTGVPGSIGGFTVERVLRAPLAGVFETLAAIGDRVKQGDAVAQVRSPEGLSPVTAAIDGVLRGLLQNGVTVKRGQKSGDIDPRCEVSHCFTVSDKALAIAGGVLEGLLRFSRRARL